jgi:soluble lytic murein transglycosylase-like protein
MMVQAIARAGARNCFLIPVLAIAIGALGSSITPAPAGWEPRADLDGTSADLAEIDEVLSRRAPELGLPLRQRTGRALLDEAKQARLDPLLVLGLIEVESSFDGQAISWAGARGLMQLTPATLEYLAAGEDLRLTTGDLFRDPALQVRLGVRYLARLEKRFGTLDLALMAYNAGPEKLRSALAEGDIERFKSYVRAVRRTFARFRHSQQLAQEAAIARLDRLAPALSREGVAVSGMP